MSVILFLKSISFQSHFSKELLTVSGNGWGGREGDVLIWSAPPKYNNFLDLCSWFISHIYSQITMKVKMNAIYIIHFIRPQKTDARILIETIFERPMYSIEDIRVSSYSTAFCRSDPFVKMQLFRVDFLSTIANAFIHLYYWLIFCFKHVTYRWDDVSIIFIILLVFK